MNQPGDDAQRDMEQRALRNVRGLLDKVEDQERLDRKTTVKIAVICGVAAVVLFAITFLWVSQRTSSPAGVIVMPPAANPAR